jgi:ATP-dependent exoDNAse (exonuclease V) alpha subunit
MNDETLTPQQENDLAKLNREKMNEKQANVYDTIIAAVNNNGTGEHLFFLDAPGGCGKSFVINTLIGKLRGEKKVVLPYATTGIAADLLSGGKTMHSGFGIPIPLFDNSKSKIKKSSVDWKLMKNSSLIIIDEASMITVNSLDLIDRLLREIMKSNIEFGGKVILLSGDFRQCLPVVKGGSEGDVVRNSIKNSKLWKKFTVLNLTENIRAKNQPEFQEWLLKVGDGMTQDNTPDGMVKIPQKYICENDIVNEIYGEGNIDIRDEEGLADKVILTAKNKDVLKLNKRIMEKIIPPSIPMIIMGNENKLVERETDGSVTYHSVDELRNSESSEDFTMTYLNSLTPSGMPPHKLELKEGCIVMLLRNISSTKGMCNGTRLIVQQLGDHFIKAKILGGSKKNTEVLIPRIDIQPSDIGINFVRRQFPLIPSFAMTINKSQGQSFLHVGIDLNEPLFSHGQLYVALSRCKEEKNLKIRVENKNNQGENDEGEVLVKNVVFKSIFNM